MGAWSKLEAVNHVLEAGGQPPVSSLDTDSASAVAIVERLLKAERLRELSRGWEFNTTFPILTPDINSNILMGDEILSVDGYGAYINTKYTIKNGKLLDTTNQTDEFTSTVQVKIITDIDFEDLRTQLQYQLMSSVAKSFQRRYQQDDRVDAELVEEEQEARVASAEEEIRNHNHEPRDNTPLGRILKTGVFRYD